MTMLVVAAALTDGDGRVLMARRPAGKQHAGLWEFPGGKVEAGEAPADALVRELHEELGIAVDARALAPLTFSEARGARCLLLLLYRCCEWHGVPRAIEPAEIRWVAPRDLAQLDMPPADRPLAATLAAER